MSKKAGATPKISERFRHLGAEPEAKIMGIENFQRRHPGCFDGTAFEGQKTVYVNPHSGWANVSTALQRVIEITSWLKPSRPQSRMSRLTHASIAQELR
jgi:hypothetical protein